MTQKPVPTVEERILQRLNDMINQQKRLEAATLTVALLDKRRKALSIAELLEITRDVLYARNAMPNNPDYQEWAKTKDERLNFVHK